MSAIHIYTLTTYLLYLPISLAITIWVARTLRRNGRVFLITAFNDNISLADSVNHLLVVGFYLINIGYVALALRYGTKPTNLTAAVEFLSTKVGFVLLVLGAMHFLNLYIFHSIHTRHDDDYPPMKPDGYTNTPPASPRDENADNLI